MTRMRTSAFRILMHRLGYCLSALALMGTMATTLASILPMPSLNRKQPMPNDHILLVPWIKTRTAPTATLEQFTPDGQPASLWLYQGSLMDPVTGKVLAQVEGFEVVTLQGLWQNETVASGGGGSSSSSSRSSTMTSGTRKTKKVNNNIQNTTSFLAKLPPQNPVTNWTRTLLERKGSNGIDQTMQAAATWESRKIFLYRSTADGHDLLTTVRLRPAGPQRKIPLSQAISTWHSTTTVVQPGTTPTMGNPDAANHFFFGTVLNTPTSSSSSPTLVWNTAPVTWEDDANVGAAINAKKKKKKKVRASTTTTLPKGQLEFTIHARPRRGSQEAALQRHFAQLSRPSGLSPPRSALVSLGGNTGGSPSADATAAHETYRYSLPSGRLSYSRYGEGPVWYGPHRTCRLELRGQYTPDLQQLSPVVQELVRRLVTAPKLTVDVLFPEEVRARQNAQPAWYKHAQWIQPYWQRLVQATTLQTLPPRSS